MTNRVLCPICEQLRKGDYATYKQWIFIYTPCHGSWVKELGNCPWAEPQLTLERHRIYYTFTINGTTYNLEKRRTKTSCFIYPAQALKELFIRYIRKSKRKSHKRQLMLNLWR